jgi:hypothetical protein
MSMDEPTPASERTPPAEPPQGDLPDDAFEFSLIDPMPAPLPENPF